MQSGCPYGFVRNRKLRPDLRCSDEFTLEQGEGEEVRLHSQRVDGPQVETLG